MQTKAEWVRVTRDKPCPVCARHDWCTFTADGSLALCMRMESGKQAKGDGGGWLHKLADPLPDSSGYEKQEKTKPNIDWTERANKMFLHGKASEVRQALSVSLGVSVASLEALQVGCGWDYSGAEFSSWPQRNGEGWVTGISRRYEDSAKKSMQHSTPGLHYEEKWQSHNSSIFVVEGGSDVATLITMGLCGIGRPSNLGGVKEIVRLMQNEKRRVIVVGERDEKPEKRGTVATCPANCSGCNWCWPGKSGAITTARKLLKEFRKLEMKNRVSWVVVELEKDTRAFYQKFGDGRAYKRMIERNEMML